MIANVNITDKHKQTTPADFMPKFGPDAQERAVKKGRRKPLKDPKELKHLFSMAAAFGRAGKEESGTPPRRTRRPRGK